LKPKAVLLFLILSITWLVSACAMPTVLPAETLDLSTRTPSASPSPTETIQWFPPTNTPVPLVTRTVAPTANLRPGVNTAILQEDFSSQETGSSGQSESGNIAFGKQQLSLAVSLPKGYLSSFRSEPVLSDFYLEIAAAPNLCRASDSYGLILRAVDAYSFYRFVLNCNGMTRFEQVKNGRLSVLQDWTLSGQVPVGAPARVKLGVWAYGDEMRLFVGDVYQFSVLKLTVLEGRLGVFARSEGANALTVSYSDLTVYSLLAVPPTVAPTTALSATP
jgi:hypothetical protein